jgi:chemotaxis response regulator CheB
LGLSLVSKIRVLVADSSSADIDALIGVLSTDREIEVIGVAKTGKQLIDLVSRLRPDMIIVSDSLRGCPTVLEAIKQIMAYNPTPILISTDPDTAFASGEDKNDIVLKALSMGALDVIERCRLKEQREESREPLPFDGATRSQSTKIAEEQIALSSKAYATELIEAVKLLSKIKVVTHLAGKLGKKGTPEQRADLGSSISDSPSARNSANSNPVRRDSRSTERRDSRSTNALSSEPFVPTGCAKAKAPSVLVAIGASTGGPRALAEVLRRLPVAAGADAEAKLGGGRRPFDAISGRRVRGEEVAKEQNSFTSEPRGSEGRTSSGLASLGIGLVIVQHVAEGFSAGLAEWLDKETEINVREARDGDLIESGCAFLAPTGFHMVVQAGAFASTGNRIVLSQTPPVAGHRPSADVLFASVAGVYGHNSIGVILTGMGTDGAKGLAAIKNAGGRTIAQDEQSSVVFGMPKAAIQTGVVDEILPLDSIAEEIVRFASAGADAPAFPRGSRGVRP